MSDSNDNHNDAGNTARIKPRRRWRISPVWLIPLAVILIGAWLLYQNVISRGPEIILVMNSADGIHAGKTQVKVRNVGVGHVDDVRLAKNYQHIIVTVQMNPGTKKLLVKNSRFWLVKARFGRQGISGLGTLLSGAYILLAPGDSEQARRHFQVQKGAPVIENNEPGIHIELTSSGNNTLTVGAPILYQGQTAGQIESAHFSLAHKQVVYQVFIHEPFSSLVTQATQFWLRSGVSFHLGTKGVNVQIGSLQSVLSGGITFGRVPGIKPGKKVTDGAHFKLYGSQNAAIQNRFKEKIKYIVLLNNSVHGLSDDAPVEYRGLRVGTVMQVPFYPKGLHLQQFSQYRFKIPVLIALEPQRPGLSWAHWTKKQWRRHTRRFFARGLRATVKSANLLTGAKVIDLTFDHHAPEYQPRKIGHYALFPSEPSQIANIQQQLSDLADKLNSLDLKAMSGKLQHLLTTGNATLGQFERAAKSLNALLAKPGMQRLPGQLRSPTTTQSYPGQFSARVTRLSEAQPLARPTQRHAR
jgi:paraquat-inducible protein B